MLPDQIICEGGQADAAKESTDNKDKDKPAKGTFNRVMDFLDPSFIFDWLMAYIYKAQLLSTFLQREAQYIDPTDGQSVVMIENGKFRAFH